MIIIKSKLHSERFREALEYFDSINNDIPISIGYFGLDEIVHILFRNMYFSEYMGISQFRMRLSHTIDSFVNEVRKELHV